MKFPQEVSFQSIKVGDLIEQLRLDKETGVENRRRGVVTRIWDESLYIGTGHAVHLYAQNEGRVTRFTLMHRDQPKLGSVWVHPDGNRYLATEQGFVSIALATFTFDSPAAAPLVAFFEYDTDEED